MIVASLSPDARRRLFHGLSLGYALLYMALGRTPTAVILGVLLAALTALEARRLRDPRLNDRLFRASSELFQDRDAVSPLSPFWALAGCFLAAALLPDPDIARTAMVYLAVADVAGSLVGKSMGRLRVGDKSAEGTLAVFLTAWAVGALSLTPVPGFPEVLAGALAVAVVEALVPGPEDDLAIPVASGAVLTLLRHLVH